MTEKPTTRRNLLGDIGGGIFLGLSTTATVALVGLALLAVTDGLGAGVLTPVGRGLLAGVISGAAFGVMRPWAGRWWGALIVGVAVVAIVLRVFLFPTAVPGGSPEKFAWLSLVVAMIVGPLLGWFFWLLIRTIGRIDGQISPTDSSRTT